MALLNLHHYKNSRIPEKYWDLIADYLSCCEKEIKDISEDRFDYIRWNEKKLCFQSLLDFLKIPYDYHKQIEKEIRCPECGGKIPLNSFISINYGYEAERYRRKLEAHINQKVHGDINKFIRFLEDFPMLGLQNEVGLRISSAIKNEKLLTIKNEEWYRARKPCEDCPLEIFSKKDMEKPPIEKTPEGRFNHYGQPVLYLGNSDTICAKEVNEGNEQVICWIQKVQIKEANVLDITHIPNSNQLNDDQLLIARLIISGELQVHNSEHNGYYKPEYAITRFIADLCRNNNIDGIKYISAHKDEYEKEALNLVLFNDDCYEFTREPILYCGNEKILHSCEMGGVKLIFRSR